MFEAVCVKEIRWHDRTYRGGDPIKLTNDDAETLREAGVIGNIRKISKTEFAVKKAPENAKRTHRKKSK